MGANTRHSRWIGVALALFAAVQSFSGETSSSVYVDSGGVIRWRADDRELAVFGANYCLASACDFRAAGYVGADRKKLVEDDFAHFVRMGWDAVRLCFWGDWENSDGEGNLIANEHLEILDYAISVARRRGISILLTPITTYSSIWPDGQDGPEVKGFSKVFKKSALGADPEAIAAQCNYLRQILDHVNPYTNVALKDEPAILLVELINEPWHHSSDLAGSIGYIDALAEAVRSTGCDKLIFYNLSQDFDIAPAIKASSVDGMTFAWYPTGLNSGRELTANFLRTVDEFWPMARPNFRELPKIVYEFDSPDMSSGYMYPAMVRAFRGSGAQFIAMFSYDMLATAPYNLGWQTHFLNLVYSPRKAVSAIVAAEATKRLPRYSHWGDYPSNREFGPFRVSYEQDLSEMVTEGVFLHSNSTDTRPTIPSELRKIVGVGSSPVVGYEGTGAYFLDRLAPGVWRLELYPDAVQVLDPFAQFLNTKKAAVRLLNRTWNMELRLPELGSEFTIEPLNSGNTWRGKASQGRFDIRPGVYVLHRKEVLNRNELPREVDGVGLDEFVCPIAPDFPAELLPRVNRVYLAHEPAVLAVDVIAAEAPSAVSVHFQGEGEGPVRTVELHSSGGFRYSVEVDSIGAAGTAIEFYFTAEVAGDLVRFPVEEGSMLRATVAGKGELMGLFAPDEDFQKLSYTRIGDGIRHGISERRPATGSEPASLRLFLPLSRDRGLDDYTASMVVKERVLERTSVLSDKSVLQVKARGSRDGQQLHVTLVEADGTSWSVPVDLGEEWREFSVPLHQFKIARGVMLPLGFPGRWNYWLTPAQGRGGPEDQVRPLQIEQLQFSLRPDGSDTNGRGDEWADVASVSLDPFGLGTE